MRSDIIDIDNLGNGFQEALEQTVKMAQFLGLSDKEALRLRICAEEMLGLVRSITGEMKATFWVENKGKSFDLHLSTKTVMDRVKRYQLLSSTTSQKNAAAEGFIGWLRDCFEEAMTLDADRSYNQLPVDLLKNLPFGRVDDPEWDHYEHSILRRLADEIKISVQGVTVDMTVTKSFE